jgi:hypothetical protein
MLKLSPDRTGCEVHHPDIALPLVDREVKPPPTAQF